MAPPFQQHQGMSLLQRQVSCLVAQFVQPPLLVSRERSFGMLQQNAVVLFLLLGRKAASSRLPERLIIRIFQRLQFVPQRIRQLIGKGRPELGQAIRNELIDPPCQPPPRRDDTAARCLQAGTV